MKVLESKKEREKPNSNNEEKCRRKKKWQTRKGSALGLIDSPFLWKRNPQEQKTENTRLEWRILTVSFLTRQRERGRERTTGEKEKIKQENYRFCSVVD